MKQQYVISRNADAGELIVKEIGETDPGVFSLMCEQRFQTEMIASLAAPEDRQVLINSLRSHDFFPPDYFANLLADKLVAIVVHGEDADKDNIRMEFNDVDALVTEDELPEEEIEEEADIDELLGDDAIDDDFDEPGLLED